MSSLEIFSRSNNNEKSDKSETKNSEDSRMKELEEEPNSRISSSIYERCQVCTKKVMIHHSKCKCANFYCGKHLHQHDCTFSHFANHKSLLEKKNLKVESDKIIRL
jgi:hypothetical protein